MTRFDFYELKINQILIDTDNIKRQITYLEDDDEVRWVKFGGKLKKWDEVCKYYKLENKEDKTCQH